MFIHYAHRGASAYAPENTLPAFYKAVEQGTNGIETDIQMSSDGVLFLLHDVNLERTTNGSGPAANRTWSELSELDAGSWFDPLYTGERLVTLDMFLRLFGRKPLRLALELKAEHMEQKVLETVDAFKIRSQTTLTSFSYEIIRRLRQMDAFISLGYLVKRIDEEVIRRLIDLNIGEICPKAEFLTRDGVELAKYHGLQVRAWGTKTLPLMQHVLDIGVDGTTINFPDKLAAALTLRKDTT